MRKDEGRLCLVLCLLLLLGVCARASAQQPSDTNETSETGDEPDAEKIFRWTTTGKVYLRYGGAKATQPTRLFGFGQYKPGGGVIEPGGFPYTTYEEYLKQGYLYSPYLSEADLSLSQEVYVDRKLRQQPENKRQLFQSYNEPSLKMDDFGLDLYELLLGFEASSPKRKKWQGKARATLDVFELGARLSNSDWGGRLVEADDFDSAGVREAFVSLSRAKVGELRLGITEGVARRLDAGASDISAGNGFFGDTSKTPWHIQQLGWELGSATSGNFPKIQYLSPNFYGVSIGAEWFSNLRSPENSLQSFSRDSSSYCFPSLFYTKDKKLFEQIPGEPFRLFDNTKAPLGIDVIDGVPYFLQEDLLLGLDPVRDAGCWQGSPTGASWHEDARPSVMGGNVAVAYEKDFPKKKLSIKFAARYGVRSSEATATESNEVLNNLFAVGKAPKPNDPLFQQINRNASHLEQAVGFSTGLTWSDYSFFGGVTYLFPSSIALESVGGETLSEKSVEEILLENVDGETLSEKGVEGILWSVGIRIGRLIPHKKGSDGKRKRKGALSVSFTQAFTKDPRYDEGKQEKTHFLHLQSLYPITENIAFTTDYWYGEAAVSVPFFVTTTEYPSQGVLFFERKLIPSHEFIVGLTMNF